MIITEKLDMLIQTFVMNGTYSIDADVLTIDPRSLWTC